MQLGRGRGQVEEPVAGVLIATIIRRLVVLEVDHQLRLIGEHDELVGVPAPWSARALSQPMGIRRPCKDKHKVRFGSWAMRRSHLLETEAVRTASL